MGFAGKCVLVIWFLESESQKKSYCVFGDVYGVMMFCFSVFKLFQFLVGCVCLPRNRRKIMIFHFFLPLFFIGVCLVP